MEEKLSLLSEDARKLHRQIFKTLLLQVQNFQAIGLNTFECNFYS